MTREYDDKRQLVSETFPDGRKFTYEYDDQGNKVSTTFPDGEKIFFFEL